MSKYYRDVESPYGYTKMRTIMLTVRLNQFIQKLTRKNFLLHQDGGAFDERMELRSETNNKHK